MPCPGTTARRPSNNGPRPPGAEPPDVAAASVNPSSSPGRTGRLWEQAGSPLIESSYGGGGTPLYYDVANLPTDPSKMSAYFASQADLVQAADGPLNTLWDFSTAATFLESGASGPQRAALLEYMATIPGVVDAGSGTTLGTKQTGTIFAMPSTAAGYTLQVIIDQATSEVLEQRLVVSDPSKLIRTDSRSGCSRAGDCPVSDWSSEGTTEDFLYAGIAGSSSAIPNGAPALPALAFREWSRAASWFGLLERQSTR